MAGDGGTKENVLFPPFSLSYFDKKLYNLIVRWLFFWFVEMEVFKMEKPTVKIEIELNEEMVANLALMGGYFSHQQAIEHAGEDIQTILSEKMLALPVKHGKIRVGLANNESKTAWIEFQRDWSSASADLALVDTEFGDSDDLTILTYSDPYNENYTDRTIVSKLDMINALDGAAGVEIP